MIENILVNQVNIYSKQIVNEGGIRKENLVLKGTRKGRLGSFYTANDTTQINIQNIVQDRRKLYLEKAADIQKGDVVEVMNERFEVLNVYKAQDMNGVHHIEALIKNIK